MTNLQKDKTPIEIPVKKEQPTSTPPQDPMEPSKNNPINPKTDEPTGFIFPA